MDPPGRCWRHRALQSWQLSQNVLSLAGDFLLVWGRWDVDKVRTLTTSKLVLSRHREGLRLGHFLGDPLDTYILIESHGARFRQTRLLGPQGRRPLHLEEKYFDISIILHFTGEYYRGSWQVVKIRYSRMSYILWHLTAGDITLTYDSMTLIQWHILTATHHDKTGPILTMFVPWCRNQLARC